MKNMLKTIAIMLIAFLILSAFPAQAAPFGQAETSAPDETSSGSEATSTETPTVTEMPRDMLTAAPTEGDIPTATPTEMQPTPLPSATEIPNTSEPERPSLPDEMPILSLTASVEQSRQTSGLASMQPLQANAAGIRKIAAGGYHTCVLTAGGGIKCWGGNWDGQLGDGTTTERHTPMGVSGLGSGVTTIAAGWYHTCALTAGGGVKCWGYNASGQMGDGTNTDRHTPVNVSGLGSGVAAITAGDGHTCALTTGGAVKCWGYNEFAQLGDGTTTNRLTPVYVSGLGSGVTAIAAGGEHTCALTAGGALKCWGWNSDGQVGDGTTTNRSTPVTVSGLGSGVASISPGFLFTCALTVDGAVKCWGYNASGQMGDGTTTERHMPVTVNGLGGGVAAITACYYRTCALTTGGAVKCWGANDYGQLGDGTTTERHTPVDINELDSGVAAIAAGGQHTCALMTSGALKCWGRNDLGQLGDGTSANSNVPVDVVGLQSYAVHGTVTLNSIGLLGVTVSGSGKTTTTDSSGNYVLSGLNAGSVTVIPSRIGLIFTPLSRSVTITNTDVSGINFAAIGFNLPFNGSMGGIIGAQGTWNVNTFALYSNTLAAISGPAPGPHYQASIYVNANFPTLDYRVQVMRSGCETCATKLFVRGDGIPAFAGWKNGYQFNIKRSGYYYVGKTINGTLYTIKTWTYNAAIKKASNWNLLRVVARGTSLKFYINNSLVWSGVDGSRTTGKVGAGLYSNGTGGLNRLYIDYATLTTNVTSLMGMGTGITQPSPKSPVRIDPLGGNY